MWRALCLAVGEFIETNHRKGASLGIHSVDLPHLHLKLHIWPFTFHKFFYNNYT